VHVVLGGIPYPAKILPDDVILPLPDSLADTPFAHLADRETAVVTENVGDPRSDPWDHGLATGYIAQGTPIPVKFSGDYHPSTGLRCLVPVDPTTGELTSGS